MSTDNDAAQSDDSAVKEAREKANQSFIELSRQILDILPTVEETLDRMSIQLDELKLEASVGMLQVFGDAMKSIGEALPSVFFENENIDKVSARLDAVFESVGSIIAKYDAGEITAIKSCLTTELVPNFQSFRQELETALRNAFPPS